MGLFGGNTDRGELLELQARVAQLEEHLARLTAAVAALSAPAPVVPTEPAAPPAPAPSAPADTYAEARALAASGNKIHAIKLVRDQSGMSLKAAKDLVESW